MATDKKGPRATKRGAKKSEAKKPSAKETAATAARIAARKTAVVKAPAPTPQSEPVLVNALKPEKMPAEAALMDRTFATFEKSLKAAVPAAVAINHKLVDIAEANLKASMALARDLASAKSPLEMIQLGMTYWHDNMGVLSAQALELRTLSSAVMASANEPIRERPRGS